jgi:hypothetical protein
LILANRLISTIQRSGLSGDAAMAEISAIMKADPCSSVASENSWSGL